MTYEKAVDELQAYYDAGMRDVQLSPTTYAAYCGGLRANTRLVNAVDMPAYEWVWFRNMKVRKGVENIGLVARDIPPCEDFEFPPCD